MEVTLAQIWQQVLEVEQVGRFDDYFVLGGDSILSIPELPPRIYPWGNSESPASRV